ncbi:hypothetical protein BGZ70_002623 [Mortierella alpina]|uniref:Uncharacterized protein n=1 Tax=Mortierella alpina TaxID=64518 RepID=A0A9P6M5I1_MORAP|nr:hypothetical protein BGZ70_002623 [Mortierella alpina]
MGRSINWLRILIICLALASFLMGFVLRERRQFPDILTIMLASEIVIVFLYSEFVYRSGADTHFRGWRYFLRVIMAFLTIYGPTKALRECSYYEERNYKDHSQGFHTTARINCILERDDVGEVETMLPLFRLFRARCIITLTVCALIAVELYCYGWSKEGTGQARVNAEMETRNDVELTDTLADDSQKTMVPDPPHATV